MGTAGLIGLFAYLFCKKKNTHPIDNQFFKTMNVIFDKSQPGRLTNVILKGMPSPYFWQ
jgi:hypothetical protein